MPPERALAPPGLAPLPALPALRYGLQATPERLVLHVRPLEGRRFAYALRFALRFGAPLSLLAPLLWPGRQAFIVPLLVWVGGWAHGMGFAIRVAPFEGPIFRALRRSLVVVFPPEAGYREGAPGGQLHLDGQAIERGRVERIALARLREPLQWQDAYDPWTVNLVLSDSVVRVAKLGDHATAIRLAETLAAALGVGFDPADVANVLIVPGHPLSWKLGVSAVGHGLALAALLLVAGIHGTMVGWVAAVAVALALDVTVNDLLLVRYGRRKAGEEARVTFRLR